METKIFRIYGPPGTGKTTALLNRVDEALSAGVDPSLIGYFAFTKQAANEAVERASKRFGFDKCTDTLLQGGCERFLFLGY